jgi:hypothetical protein
LIAARSNLPVIALEKPADIARFKAEYRQGRKVATCCAPMTRSVTLGIGHAD